MKTIDNSPITKREELKRAEDGRIYNPYLLQEPQHFNKPSQLIRQLVDTPLTIRQKKMFSYFLRELLKTDKTTASNEIEVDVGIMIKFLGTDTDKKDNPNYEKDLKRLQKTSIEIDYYNEENNLSMITTSVLISSWDRPKDKIAELGLFDKKIKKTLTVRFDTKLTSILKEIYSYAKLDLTVIRKLKITHSLTLYEIFKRRLIKVSRGKLNLTEKEIREYLSLEDKYIDIKDLSKQLKRWVKDIQVNSYMTIEYNRIKRNGIHTYYFIIAEFMAVPFTVFKNKITKMKGIENLVFIIDKKEYSFVNTPDNEENLYITDHKKYMDTSDSKFNFNKSYTLKKDDAVVLWDYLYKEFLDNQYLFFYRFYIDNNMDTKFQASDIGIEKYQDNIEEYYKYFEEK